MKRWLLDEFSMFKILGFEKFINDSANYLFEHENYDFIQER